MGNRIVQTISGSTESHYLYGGGDNQLVRYYDMQNGVSVDHKIARDLGSGLNFKLNTWHI